jgi:TPR repeat protein
MKFGFLAAILALAFSAPFEGAAQASPQTDALTQCDAANDRKDFVTAFKLCRPLAEQGNAKAQANLGYAYAMGRGVPQDYAAAVSWFRKAAAQGNARSQYSLGVSYTGGKGVLQDYAAAVSWYRKAAEQGYASAQTNLGAAYETGQGVPQDYAAAVSWYRTAAEQGDADAQNNLGAMYSDGRGVPQDYAAAVNWFRKAAQQGHAYGQNNLGLMYSGGKGVPQDYVQAHKWLNLAASTSTAARVRDSAVKERDRVAVLMSPTEIAKAQALASAFEAKPETVPAGSNDGAPNKQDDGGLIIALAILVPLAIGFVLLVARAARGAEAAGKRAGLESQQRADKERADRERADKERADKQQSESARSKARREKARPWYEVLGVDRDMSAQDVTSAYRALIGQYHPDKVSGLGQEFKEIAERKSREINNAYAEYKKERE